jgi:hypothetical protein
MTFSISAFSILAFSITGLFVTQRERKQNSASIIYAECHVIYCYAECHVIYCYA